jgi:hypothetical protein
MTACFKAIFTSANCPDNYPPVPPPF